jgi:hypothetical protein
MEVRDTVIKASPEELSGSPLARSVVADVRATMKAWARNEPIGERTSAL